MREVATDFRTRARCKRVVDTRKSWIIGKGQFPHELSCLDVLEKVHGNEVHSRVKAALAHLGSSEGQSSALQGGIFDDQKTLRTRSVERGVLTHGAEMGIDGDWDRGQVWFKKLRMEERAVIINRRPNSTSTELVYTGEIVPGWNDDFTALWKEAMDESTLRE